MLTCVWLFCDPMDYTCQAPLSKGFPRQEYWSGLSFPFPGDIPDPVIELESPAWRADSSPQSHLGSPLLFIDFICSSVSLLIPSSWFIPPPPLSPLVTINLFSMLVSLSLSWNHPLYNWVQPFKVQGPWETSCILPASTEGVWKKLGTDLNDPQPPVASLGAPSTTLTCRLSCRSCSQSEKAQMNCTPWRSWKRTWSSKMMTWSARWWRSGCWPCPGSRPSWPSCIPASRPW